MTYLCSVHIFEGGLDGTRSTGRPRRRPGDNVIDWTGKTLAQCTTVATEEELATDVSFRGIRPSAMNEQVAQLSQRNRAAGWVSFR